MYKYAIKRNPDGVKVSRDIAELMNGWGHGGDAINQLASNSYFGRIVSRETAENALEDINRKIAADKHGIHTWSKSDLVQLGKIARAIRLILAEPKKNPLFSRPAPLFDIGDPVIFHYFNYVDRKRPIKGRIAKRSWDMLNGNWGYKVDWTDGQLDTTGLEGWKRWYNKTDTWVPESRIEPIKRFGSSPGSHGNIAKVGKGFKSNPFLHNTPKINPEHGFGIDRMINRAIGGSGRNRLHCYPATAFCPTRRVYCLAIGSSLGSGTSVVGMIPATTVSSNTTDSQLRVLASNAIKSYRPQGTAVPAQEEKSRALSQIAAMNK